MYFYFVHNLLTNKFSTGGSSPKWKSSPKVWASKSAFHNHLSLIIEERKSLSCYQDCDVIIIDLENQKFTRKPFEDHIGGTKYDQFL